MGISRMGLVLMIVLTCYLASVSGGKMKMKSALRVLKKVAVLIISCKYQPSVNDPAQVLYVNQITSDGGGFYGVAFDVPEETTKEQGIYKIKGKVDTKGGASYLELFIRYATPEDEGVFECGAYIGGTDGKYTVVSDKQTIKIKSPDRVKTKN